MDKVLRGMKKREIWVNILGVVLARAVVFSMNPIAMGYFAAVYAERSSRLFIFFAMLLGMATAMPAIDVIKYGLVMLVVVIITNLFERGNRKILIVMMGGMAGGVTAALNITKGLLYVNYQYYIMLALLEGILIFVVSIVLHKGIHYFLYARKGQNLNNEELISMAIIWASFSYAMPAIPTGEFSLVPTLAYIFVMFMGYKYGAGSGAIAGAACGAVIGIGSGSLNMIGIMCLLGICSGMFREIGRVGTAVAFVTVSIFLGYFYENSMVKVEQARALASSVVVFLFFPKKLLYRINLTGSIEGERAYVKHNLQIITKNKLREFSDSFQKLSKTFYHIADTKVSLNRKDVDGIFEELSDKVCKECVKCDFCWKHNYYNTYQSAYSIIGAVDRNGKIDESDIPTYFAHNCINYGIFLEETKRSLELAKINLSWHNRMAESREAIASQLGEVANIIKDFAVDIYETKETNSEIEQQIINKLVASHIEVNKLSILEKRGKKQEIYLTAKTKRGRCITTKEAATCMGAVLEKRFRPSEGTKNIIPKEYEELVFVEDVNFKILTGVARMTKPGEEVSGDNFSFLHLNTGEMIMTLSDGMGTGKQAHMESESVVELMEQFIEAGFKETSAIKLINSVLVLKSNKQSFSTVDMGVINLFTGVCEFIKVGAAASFIKRDRWVETICSTSMPAGIFNQVDFDGVSKKLYDGDMVIMMSDGVLDCFSGNNKEQYIEDILMGVNRNNPKEIANYILERAMEQREDAVFDDMTVMVAGMWEKVG